MRIAKLFGWEAPLLAQLLHLRELASLHSHSSPITSPITSPVTSFVISSFSPFVHSAFLFRISFPHSVFRTSFSALVSRTCFPHVLTAPAHFCSDRIHTARFSSDHLLMNGSLLEQEIRSIRNNMLLMAVMQFIFSASPILVTTTTFALYAALGHQMTAATAFTSLSLFNILSFPLLVFPMIITYVIDLTVVNRRLTTFFNSPERATIDLDEQSHPPRAGTPPPRVPPPPPPPRQRAPTRPRRSPSRGTSCPRRELSRHRPPSRSNGAPSDGRRQKCPMRRAAPRPPRASRSMDRATAHAAARA